MSSGAVPRLTIGWQFATVVWWACFVCHDGACCYLCGAAAPVVLRVGALAGRAGCLYAGSVIRVLHTASSQLVGATAGTVCPRPLQGPAAAGTAPGLPPLAAASVDGGELGSTASRLVAKDRVQIACQLRTQCKAVAWCKGGSMLFTHLFMRAEVPVKASVSATSAAARIIVGLRSCRCCGR